MEISTTDTPQTTPTRTTGGIPVTYELDGVYIISDSCFDYVIRMKTLANEKDDFPTLCQNALQGNDRLLSIIQEFKDGYSAERAIFWLNRDPFFLLFINLIFKTGNIEGIFPCRVFLQDIKKQLEQNKCTSTIVVYRSEPIPDEQFKNLKSFNGKTIAIKEFFLTNSNRDKALSYTADYSSCDEFKCVLFTIEANPQIENAKLFANIGSIGYVNDPDDVLFMIGSLFEITEIEDEKDGIINIKMRLCANNDMNTVQQLCDGIKNRYIDENGQTDLLGFGRFLIELGNSMNDSIVSNAGEKSIHSFLDKLPDDHPDRPRCYDALGDIDSLKNNLDSSLEWHKKSLDIKKKNGANDLNVAESYQNLASGYSKKGDSTESLKYFNELLMIWKSSYGDDYYNLIFCYTQMAIIYEREENVNEAIACYYRALAIMLKYEAVQEVSYATLYNNLGNAYTGLKRYHLALGYYNTSLEIKTRINPAINPSTAATFKNIGVVHECMNNIQQSRENLQKAADIYRQVYSADDENVTEIEELIRKLPNTDQN